MSMSEVIDMTAAFPYANGGGSSSPAPAQGKMSVSFNPAALATMRALAANGSNQLRRGSLQDDQTMKSAASMMSTTSMYSSAGMDHGDDDYSSSSWSDSDDEGDEASSEFIMYAPTGSSNRAHLLRPMSVDQITALARATGAQRPACLQSAQTGGGGGGLPRAMTLQQPPPRGPPANPGPNGPRSVSLPALALAPQLEHYRQMKAALSNTSSQGDPNAPKKPDDLLKEILEEDGKTIEYCLYTSLENYFLKVQPQHVEAFQQDVISAVRTKNVDDLRALLKRGKMLQCCNKFGESIVHMACRQSSAQVLEFLIGEAHVDIRVICDSGRTPLHDACWTSSPDFDIIQILLKKCPDFLRIKDKRGFSPLAYVPHGQWGCWGDFLKKNKDLLVFSKLD